MASGVRHALARLKAHARARRRSERPDRTEWSGVRLPRVVDWGYTDGRLTARDSWTGEEVRA